MGCRSISPVAEISVAGISLRNGHTAPGIVKGCPRPPSQSPTRRSPVKSSIGAAVLLTLAQVALLSAPAQAQEEEQPKKDAAMEHAAVLHELAEHDAHAAAIEAWADGISSSYDFPTDAVLTDLFLVQTEAGARGFIGNKLRQIMQLLKEIRDGPDALKQGVASAALAGATDIVGAAWEHVIEVAQYTRRIAESSPHVDMKGFSIAVSATPGVTFEIVFKDSAGQVPVPEIPADDEDIE